MNNTKKPELLAPAGSPAAFYGAVHAGADAVYLAGNRFGARAYAENFTTEELVTCIRYGHLLGRKLYLTVNTLMKEQEIAELYDYIQPFYEAGLDAVIVQDFGVFRYLKNHFPGLELHASTQMTLCSSNGARFLKEMGATRIVPARELSLQELKEIKSKVDIELETFIHGAMCYCYSGQCLFSSILGGRSGNRGRCAQPCRLPYSLKTDNKKTGKQYLLSLKDMCTIEHIPELIDAGIDSFKIEGRMKKPEYAAGVTAIYRKYIDRYLQLCLDYGESEAAKHYTVEPEDMRHLESLYIRSEIQDGYYFKHNGKEMVTLSSPAYSGSDETLLENIRQKHLSEPLRLPLSFNAIFHEGEPAELKASCGEIAISVIGAPVEKAQKQPVTEDNIRKQLGKLGDTAFYAKELIISVSGNPFYPLKQINDLRRIAVQALEEAILSANGYTDRTGLSEKEIHSHSTHSSERAAEVKKGSFAISVSTISQLKALEQWLKKHPNCSSELIYIPGDLVYSGEAEVLSVCEKLAETSILFLSLPYILREKEEGYLKELYFLCDEKKLFSGFLIRSADGLGFLLDREKNCRLHLDANVYTWNHEAIAQFGERIDSFCLPYELKSYEQHALLRNSGASFEKVVYSRIPMMITANCVLRTSDRCRKYAASETLLVDRYDKEFPVVRNCTHCTNIIYNSLPLSLYQELSQWTGKARLRLDFTVESAAEMESILDSFLTGAPFRPSEYTTGHEKRGVE